MYFINRNRLFLFSNSPPQLVKEFDFPVNTWSIFNDAILLNNSVCYNITDESFSPWETNPFILIKPVYSCTRWYEYQKKVVEFDEEFEDIVQINSTKFIGTTSNVMMLCDRDGSIKLFDFGKVRRNSKRIFCMNANVDSDYCIEDYTSLTFYDENLNNLKTIRVDIDFASFEVDETHLFIQTDERVYGYSLDSVYSAETLSVVEPIFTLTVDGNTYISPTTRIPILRDSKLAYGNGFFLQYTQTRFECSMI